MESVDKNNLYEALTEKRVEWPASSRIYYFIMIVNAIIKEKLNNRGPPVI